MSNNQEIKHYKADFKNMFYDSYKSLKSINIDTLLLIVLSIGFFGLIVFLT
jgi:hypothetical protein